MNAAKRKSPSQPDDGEPPEDKIRLVSVADMLAAADRLMLRSQSRMEADLKADLRLVATGIYRMALDYAPTKTFQIPEDRIAR